MKAWFRIFVAFISVSLIIIIFKRIDVNLFLDVFLNMKIGIYFLGLSAILLTQFLFALRWKLTITDKFDIKYISLLYRTITSYFFNNLFLGVFGGDIYKALRIHKNTGKFIAMVSVIYNRIINTYAIAVIPIFLSLFFINDLDTNKFLYYSILISGLLLLIFIIILSLKKHIMTFVSKFLKNKENINILNDISLIKTMLLSLLIQVMNIIAHFCFASALGIDIDIFSLAVLYSACAVIISIPISINGIGVRESVFIFAFGFWNISAENAVAFSFMSFMSTIILSLIGGSIFVGENLIRAKNDK